MTTCNKTELKQRGWTDKLIATLLPKPRVEMRHKLYVGDYTVYLWDIQVVKRAERRKAFAHAQERKQKVQQKLNKYRHVDLLPAIFTVNRAAKRRRDAAQKYYQNGMHGFAKSSRREKDNYYGLKDAGIMAAHQAGRLQCVAVHGGLYLWRGEGYSFHSTLKPKGLDIPDLPLREGEEHLFVEAKPKGAKEPRLRDAVNVLEEVDASIDLDESAYERAASPNRRASRAPLVCWNCGEEGHVASECNEDDDLI